MRITVCAVGRLKRAPEAELCSDYLARAEKLGRQVGLSKAEIIEVPESQSAQAEARKTQEAGALEAKLSPGAMVICLDEHGQHVDSKEFSKIIKNAADSGTAELAFLLGGPDGLSQHLVSSATRTLCFGRMTWPHRLARVMLLEQIYRAVTLMVNHPYHRV
ncbi:MAG: 23S rRNA (pseudouridine(1915)-N(3))-methyltransferase RlmH [Alphaproteobacteria bacterium]|nr:23S rRNA (pseudouridine(1915)-N(3))-methyltransferase RlmH [Alphaproteobacteria bacterium]